MKQLISRIIFGTIVVFSAGFAGVFLTKSGAAFPARSTSSPEKSLYLKQIRSYKKWTRVNLMSLPLNPLNAGLCRAPTTAEVIASGQNPHRENGKFFAVYVNEIGRKAMLSQIKPSFPLGSIIVKEKLPAERSNAAELLTVMIKREKDFNRGFGDWEFLVLDGNADEVQARGNLAHCQACHLQYSDTDYVFRTYLPEAVRQGLH